MFLYIIIGLIIICAIISRLTHGYCESPTCLVGKVAIVTGGNSGIGYQVCLNLASRGCKVIIADKDDSTKNKNNIVALTGNNNIITKHLDLASFNSIRQFVKDIKETESKIDLLINNAGIGFPPPNLTEDGFKYIIQVNYLGPFLLTNLLIDLLKKTNSRIVFTSSVSSATHDLSTTSLKNQTIDTSFYGKFTDYSTSKAATLLITEVFAKRLKEQHIKVNAVHPGFVPTSILSDLISYWNQTIDTSFYGKFTDYSTSKASTLLITEVFAKRLKEQHIKVNAVHPGFVPTPILSDLLSYWVGIVGMTMAYLCGKTSWEGAQTTLYAALSKDVENITGEYIFDCKVFPKIRCRWTNDFKKEIWQLSESLTKLKDSERLLPEIY